MSQQAFEAFKNKWSAPTSPAVKAGKEVSFFEYNPDLIFTTRINLFPEQENEDVGSTRGNKKEMIRYGIAYFTVDGESCSLIVYDFGSTSFFIPFSDTAEGVYKGGRYLNCPKSDPTVLDFNQSYNPLCVYAESYDCPLVPEFNKLDIPINAGMKYENRR